MPWKGYRRGDSSQQHVGKGPVISENAGPRTVRDLGEFALIERINAGRVQVPAVLLGPGDDAAVVAAPDGRFVVTTDMLVQDRHFRLGWSSPRDIGRKAIAQNAADVVAMGAVPTAFVVALGCPADTPLDVVDGLTEGMWAEAGRAGGSIAGGDLVRTPHIVISVTAFGDLRGRAPITRGGARVGDTVAVAGVLGWSAAGLAVLTADRAAEDFAEALAAHRVPQPPYAAVLGLLADHTAGVANSGRDRQRPEAVGQVDPGQPGVGGSSHRQRAGGRGGTAEGVLGSHPESDDPSAFESAGAAFGSAGIIGSAAGPEIDAVPNALTDVSDGLLADLGHLADASRVAIDIRSTALRDPALEAIAEELDADAAQWILVGGEDHAFVGTWSSDRDLPPGWTPIGRVLAGHGVTVDGAVLPGDTGWESFSGVDSAAEPDPR